MLNELLIMVRAESNSFWVAYNSVQISISSLERWYIPDSRLSIRWVRFKSLDINVDHYGYLLREVIR